MKLNEARGNLFELDSRYCLAHCISLDCEMGLGIAVQFNLRYSGMKEFLKKNIEIYNINHAATIPYGSGIKVEVFNLITKAKYWNKPTYETISYCIERMADQCKAYNVRYLGMPRIGCGLDKLDWEVVKGIIIDKFKDVDIEIEIRYL